MLNEGISKFNGSRFQSFFWMSHLRRDTALEEALGQLDASWLQLVLL